MLPDSFYSFSDRWGSSMITRFKEVFDFLKNPGIADGGSSDHDTVHSISVLILKRFFGVIDISIAKYGNLYAGIRLHFSNQRPVGIAFIQLCAGSAMNGECLDACILKSLRNLFNIFRLVVPAEPGFDGHWQFRRIHNGLG